MNQQSMRYEVLHAKSDEIVLKSELIVIYVIKGSLNIRNMNLLTVLKKEDILLIQPGIEYSIESSQNTLYGMASYPADQVHRLFHGKDIPLYCNSTRDHRNSYQDLRKIFHTMTAEYVSQTAMTDCYVGSQLLLLLHTITEHYRLNDQDVSHDAEPDDMRMHEVMQYVMSHLYDDISLGEIAEQLYVSTSTLSRLFKKKTGTYFADYVGHMRVQRSLEFLEFTDMPLTQIAVECGFSNSSNYSRLFHKEMGTPPSEYREKAKQLYFIRKKEEEEERIQIQNELKHLNFAENNEIFHREVSLSTEMVQSELSKQIWNQTINIGPFADLTKANVQYHILYLKEQLHFTHVRIWNLFSEQMMITDGRKLGSYHYDLVDQILDFLVEHRICPFIDFGRRPNMALGTGEDSVFYQDDYVPFETKENWEDLIQEMLLHFLERYGSDEVSNWIFELSGGGEYKKEAAVLYPKCRFINAYEYLYHEIKRLIPDALFGGIGAEIARDRDTIEQFLKKCSEKEILPDYLSFIVFPDGRDLYQENQQMSEIQKLMSIPRDKKPDMKLFITEWNPIISNRSYLNDSCYRSAYMISRMPLFLENVDMLILMSGTDWVSDYIDTNGIVNGGIGILTKDRIRKPAFFALDFMNQLGSKYLYLNENTIVTQEKNGTIVILLSYAADFRRNQYLGGEDSDLEAYRKAVCEDEIPMQITIDLKDLLEDGTYRIREQRLGRGHGSILDEWSRFDYENYLGRQEIKYLDMISQPLLSEERLSVKKHGGEAKVSVTLDPQEICLIKVVKRMK